MYFQGGNSVIYNLSSSVQGSTLNSSFQRGLGWGRLGERALCSGMKSQF